MEGGRVKVRDGGRRDGRTNRGEGGRTEVYCRNH